MPTFTVNRSSSSILKHVLHEEASAVSVPLKSSTVAEEQLNTIVSVDSGTSRSKDNSPVPSNSISSNLLGVSLQTSAKLHSDATEPDPKTSANS